MNPVVAFLKASRWKNLLIIALTMVFLRYLILQPILRLVQLELAVRDWEFALIVLSTLLIAAGGNIINDYFDLKIDRINKPDKIIVGRYIKRRVAMASHVVLNTLGFLIGLFIGIRLGMWQLCFLQLFCTIALWYYSTELKYMFLWGNVAIALCVALVPLAVGIYEIPALIDAYQYYAKGEAEQVYQFGKLIYGLFYWVLGFTAFAFLATLSREIVKDIADMEGDRAFGCRTMPIVLGIQRTKIVVLVVNLLVFLSILVIQQFFLPDLYSLLYVLLVLLPITVIELYLLMKAQETKEFNRARTMGKLFVVAGISYAIVAYVNLSALA
jgi:4-hydroxybenzoate polyprenyltransferase